MRTFAQKPKATQQTTSAKSARPGGTQSGQVDSVQLPRFLRSPTVQAKPVVGQPGDINEQEADCIADQAMRMPAPDAFPTPQTRPTGSPEAAALPSRVEQVFADAPFPSTRGAPLDPAERSFFERRFGCDFEAVRVHTDGATARAAEALGAAAFTLGDDIGFGPDRYHPEGAKGRALLAHELAHVVQNAARPGVGPPVLARQTVEQYETKGVQIDRQQLNRNAEVSYWEVKLREYGFVPAIDTSTRVRLSFGEEANAVLSVVWQMRPKSPTITREIMRLVNIPQRTALGSRNLAYRITFRPPVQSGEQGTVEVIFIAEGAGATAITPETPSTSFTPKTQGGYSFSEFPEKNNEPKYWQAHRDEQRQVFSWIENTAGRRFDQIITAKTGSGANARSSSFHIKGEKERDGTPSNLVIIFVGTVASEVLAAPADYLSHDFADARIEAAQSELDPLKKDKLGSINGLEKAPATEQSSVKYAISQYFRSGTRNAEVDAIVPIVDPPAGMANRFNKGRSVLYTLRFKSPTNDVDIERIGEAGKDVSLAPQGSLAQVNGFASHAIGATEQDKVASLTAWLELRYRGVSPAASATVADLEKDVTAKIRAGSGDPTWFEKNYGIVILDATAAAEWLTKTLGFKEAKELQELKPFSRDELQILELALEGMSDLVVKTFKDVRMLRQKVNFTFVQGTRPPKFEEKPDVAGDTIVAATRTIRIFDAAMRNVDTLFRGGIGPAGKPAVKVAPALPFAHELGHVVAHAPGMQKKFDELVKAKGIKPITWYAASDPPKELFPEAFALYYLDSEWLNRNWPDLFNFFDALDKAGPPQKAARAKSP